jgi:hypothetical protein
MQDERPWPEDAGDASLYYDKNEAERYHTCDEVVQKQLELTARALEFLGLSVDQQTAAGGSSRPLIADIGCGEPDTVIWLLEERYHRSCRNCTRRSCVCLACVVVVNTLR